MTAGLISAYLFMMILVACVSETEPNPFGECGPSQKANATEVSLYYEPFENNKFALESDTVKFEKFNVYLRLGFTYIAQSPVSSSLPGVAFALSCAQILNFQNISGISIFLMEEYGGKKAGSDISNLVTVNENVKLSEKTDFSNSLGQYKLIIDLLPENKTQLKTKTILKLKNGKEKIFESTSPVLLIP